MSKEFFRTGMFTVSQLNERQALIGKPGFLIALGAELRRRRKEARRDRPDLAAACAIHADQLGRFEHGIGTISYASFKQLCAALAVDPANLIAECAGMSDDEANATLQMAESWRGPELKLDDLF